MEYNSDFQIKILPQDLTEIDALKFPLINIEQKCFKPELREAWKDKRELLYASICALAYHNGVSVGECYACELSDEDTEGDMGKHYQAMIDKYGKGNFIYGMSLGVLPKYQGYDLAKRMKMAVLVECKRRGYQIYADHAKEGGSKHLQKYFGAEVIDKIDNWYGTGDTYYWCEIGLKNLYIIPVTPFKQETDYDCGIAALEVLLTYHKMKYDREEFSVAATISEGTTHANMLALLLGRGKSSVFTSVDVLKEKVISGHPCILHVISPNVYEGHYLIVHGISDQFIYTYDVYDGIFGRMSYEELDRAWWNNITKNQWGIAL